MAGSLLPITMTDAHAGFALIRTLLQSNQSMHSMTHAAGRQMQDRSAAQITLQDSNNRRQPENSTAIGMHHGHAHARAHEQPLRVDESAA